MNVATYGKFISLNKAEIYNGLFRGRKVYHSDLKQNQVTPIKTPIKEIRNSLNPKMRIISKVIAIVRTYLWYRYITQSIDFLKIFFDIY